MRALLLFNPNASTTTPRVRDVIISALSSELKLDVQATKQRGHATHITAGAVHEGIDVVFALGGDGTANEVIQAVAGTPVRLGIIPGGSTNVLVRNLGLPNDPVEATAVLLERLREDARTTVNLGRANNRYFGANAGFGFDAAIVRLVERRYRLKRAVRQLSYVGSGLEEWFREHTWRQGSVSITLHRRDGTSEPPRTGYGFAIVGNTSPYTYLGPRPLQMTPHASFHRGLDVIGVRARRTATILRVLTQVLTTGGHVRSRVVDHWHDLEGFTLRSDVALPLQVDGDYAGEATEVTFTSVPDALTLLA